MGQSREPSPPYGVVNSIIRLNSSREGRRSPNVGEKKHRQNALL